MDELKITESLRDRNIRFVRWSFSGSHDHGCIHEIKLYDSNDNVLEEIHQNEADEECLDDSLKGVNANILRIGYEIVAEHFSGYENDDGGYGWVLWCIESDKIWLSERSYSPGMQSEFFDVHKYDRVSISCSERWTGSTSLLDAISASVEFKDNRPAISLDRTQKAMFLAINESAPSAESENRTSRRKLQMPRPPIASICVHSKGLIELLRSQGIACEEHLYYYDQGSQYFSQAPGDVITDGMTWSCDLYVFIGGWSDDFRVDFGWIKDELTPSETIRLEDETQ